MSVPSALDPLRKPEYTGENRCTPCTIVNGVIAVAVSGAVAWAVASAAGAAAGVATGGAALLLCAGAIYLRGYLVPGTPTLTKRYLPDRVLAWFDKAPGEAGPAGAADADAGFDVDPEAALADAGAIEPCETVDDLCLTDGFRAAWRDEMDGDVTADDAVDALGLRRQDCTLESFGDAYRLERGGTRLAQWPSKAALTADVAGARALDGAYDDWSRLSSASRGKLLSALRLFVETCPVCDGPVELGEETVESCCRSYEVVAVTCGDCGARLLEERWDG
ncbi:hypothetical protein G9464_00505 [Halostella sp. JP-L12]|uniref:hypothetical protein n=1 Tax=Halostella TaxID=1843185 RepID=UPI000EF81DDB|nr:MULTISPECIES: hypothetical protein [Halostella]NHN46078.1 hypothetical protein [Halostella sp. JP-L12]